MSRLRPGTVIVMVFAALFAVGGAFVVRQSMQRVTSTEEVTESKPPATAIRYVPVALDDLPVGHKVQEGDIGVLKFTPEEFANSQYSKAPFLRESKDFIGRLLKNPLQARDAFKPDSFYAEGAGPNVADSLPAGKRAVTIAIDGSGLVDGFATAGTSVDVLFRSEKNSELDAPEMTVTLLRAIEVLAVNRVSTENQYPVDEEGNLLDEVKVTLAVNPAEANVLKAVEDRGTLSLSLRSSEDMLPEVLNADLETQTTEMNRLQKELEALTRLKEVSSESGVEFTSDVRLQEVTTLLAQLEGSVADLNARMEAQKAADIAHRNTLASVLELKPRSVMIAVADIPADRMVRPGDFRTEAVADEDKATTEYRGASVENPQEFLGRIVSREIKAGDIIHPEAFYPEGAGPNIASRLPVGYRAVTVSVPAAEVVDGFAGEGATVDVFFRADAASNSDIPETTLMVLSGIDVLSVDRNPYKADDAPSEEARVALAVPVHEVPKLKALDGRGNLTLALRAADEPTVSEIASKLATAQAELKTAQVESRALQQLAELAPKKDGEIQLTAAFTAEQSGRLTELRSRLPAMEQKVNALQQELDAASQKAPMLTLAEALGIPQRIAPPPPKSVELYLGGRKQTVELGPGTPGVSIAPVTYSTTRPVDSVDTQSNIDAPATDDSAMTSDQPAAGQPQKVKSSVSGVSQTQATRGQSLSVTSSTAGNPPSDPVANLQSALVNVPVPQFTITPDRSSVERAEQLSKAVLASNDATQAAVESNARRTAELASSVSVIGTRLETALQAVEERISSIGQQTQAAVASIRTEAAQQAAAVERKAPPRRDADWKLPLYRGGKVEVVGTPVLDDNESESTESSSVSADKASKALPGQDKKNAGTADREVSSNSKTGTGNTLAGKFSRAATTIEVFHGGEQQ
jgi:pilus assembly protein CpaB